MNTATIDNAIDTELDRCITWQYDNATNLIGVINTLRDFFNQSTKAMWDGWRTDVADIDNANEFGLSVWGKLLDCRRPILVWGQPAVQQILDKEIYRKILKARFQLLGKNASMKSYCEYLYAVFGGRMKCVDGLEMNLTFSQVSGITLEEIALIQQAPDVVFVYPAGVKNNTLRNKIAFGYCGTQTGERPPGWNGVFPGGTLSKLDAANNNLIWR